MKIIGLTGGIGSGKTTVSNYLLSKGYEVIDADQIARDILKGTYSPNVENALTEVVDTFGTEVLNNDKTLDRKKLGNIVFDHLDKKKKLEEIVHGKIYQAILASMEKGRNNDLKLMFLDAPLLFETKLHQLADETWLVDTDEQIRIQRVMQRDNLTKKDIENRMKNQMSSEEKRKLAQVIFKNSGSKEDLYREIDKELNLLSF